MSPLNRIFLTLAILSGAATARASAPAIVAMRYPEDGNWIVRVYTVDPQGFPDTLERRAYATERQAQARITELRTAIGVVEKSPTSRNEGATELRDPPAGEIWTATEEWSVEWENRFADWTRENFDEKFFMRHHIETDCADATIALRWIFSRVMHLPAGNRIDNVLITNRSVRNYWKNLPTAENWYDDQRFRAALDYVMINTFTHSIAADSYPIAINDEWIKEGVFHLELRAEDGHTRVFSDVTHDRSAWPVNVLYSNVPRKVRRLIYEPFVVYTQPPLRFGGILRHRWIRLAEPSAFLVPEEQMPGYSLEQYQPEFFRHGTSDFSAEVAARLREGVDPVIGLKAVLEGLKRSISERKALVEDGYKLCSQEDCSPGTANYENWSTPARDARLGQLFAQVENYVTTLRGSDLERARELITKTKRKKLLKFAGHKYRYDDIEAVWKAAGYSFDPRDPPEKRWGFSP